MNFQKLIEQIERQIGTESLGPLKVYLPTQKLFDVEPSTSTQPLRLKDEDISALVKISALHPHLNIELSNTKIVPLLTLLLDMGTFQAQEPDMPDDILGYKDIRFENTIVALAQFKAQSTSGEVMHSECIFGSSVNPPTLNHEIFITHLSQYYSTIHVIPAGVSTLKKPEDYAPPELRFAMTQAMLHCLPNQVHSRCKLQSLEMDRCPPSRMIATLSQLILTSEPGTAFTVAFGMDHLQSFTRWYRWRDFAGLCTLKFYPRAGRDFKSMEAELKSLLECEGMKIILVFQSQAELSEHQGMLAQLGEKRIECTVEQVEMTEGSATDIRNHYQSGQQSCHPQLRPSVHEIIVNNGCFQPQNNSEELKSIGRK